MTDRRVGGSAPRRIAVCHVIHSLQPGGAEESLVTLAGASSEVGLDVTVVSLLPTAGQAVANSLEAQGVPVVSLDLSGKWDLRGFGRGVRAIRGAKPDVVHTHLKHADVVGAVAARRLGIPMVSTAHTIDTGGGPIRTVRRRAALAARRHVATTTIAVSEAQRAWYLHALGDDHRRVVTVHNGVPPAQPLMEAERSGLRRSFGVRANELMAAMVGIMRAGKGHAELLALARTTGPAAGVRFVLVGDGPLRDELEASYAEARDTSAPVVFAGFRSDVPALLAASDLVIHPSHQEALPTALLHALAAGRPILATDVGGIPEIVTPEVGLLARPGDIPALYDGLGCLLADDALRRSMGDAARGRFEDEFSASIWAGRLRGVYENALGSSDARHGRSVVMPDARGHREVNRIGSESAG